MTKNHISFKKHFLIIGIYFKPNEVSLFRQSLLFV